MIVPSWDEIEAEWREVGFRIWYCLPPHNPNRRLFKVYWRLFTRHSPWEGQEFLDKCEPICMYEAARFVERCERLDEPVWSYPLRLPRWDPARMPWDLTHPRWRDVEHWAPAYDDDPDPIAENGER